MKTFKALIVGAGGMGRAWGKNLRACDEVEIGGWVDIQPGLAAQAADELALTGIYTGEDLDRALAQVRPDFVVDVSTPEAHHAVTLRALAAGVPVLGEKPMADSMDRAREMVAASERAGKLYMVSQSRRYNANLQVLRRLIVEHVGALGILNSDFYIGAHFGGFRDDMASPLLLDMAIHTFDAARFLTGADAKAVYCHEWNPAGSWYDHDASAAAIFEMTGGIVYTYQGSWCAEGRATTWEADWRIVGQGGSVLWDGGNAFRAEASEKEAAFIRKVRSIDVPLECPKEKTGGHDGVIGEFVRCVQEGGVPETTCTDNIKSLAMVHAAVESAGKRRRTIVRA
jgi:predicted dehydrogenase